MSALDRAKERSTVLAVAERAVDRSRLRGLLGDGRDAVRETTRSITGWWRASYAGQTIEARAAALARSVETSVAADAAGAMERWVRGSFLYRWLTADSEPEAVVIDLRETRLVGPVIAVVDWGVGLLTNGRSASITCRTVVAVADYVRTAPIRAGSVVVLAAAVAGLALQVALGALEGRGLVVAAVATGLAVVGLGNDASWDELRETRTVESLVAALEPPEPPREMDRTGRRAGSADEETRSSADE